MVGGARASIAATFLVIRLYKGSQDFACLKLYGFCCLAWANDIAEMSCWYLWHQQKMKPKLNTDSQLTPLSTMVWRKRTRISRLKLILATFSCKLLLHTVWNIGSGAHWGVSPAWAVRARQEFSMELFWLETWFREETTADLCCSCLSFHLSCQGSGRNGLAYRLESFGLCFGI